MISSTLEFDLDQKTPERLRRCRKRGKRRTKSDARIIFAAIFLPGRGFLDEPKI